MPCNHDALMMSSLLPCCGWIEPQHVLAEVFRRIAQYKMVGSLGLGQTLDSMGGTAIANQGFGADEFQL